MDIHFLKQALALAETRRGFCAPNPAVGAVIVKDHEVIATGLHWAAGFPHAEVTALEKLTESESQGSTLYVTLEPCCHWGKTPPCTDILIKRGIKKVIYGMRDPNPKVAGQGAKRLQEAGIRCEYVALPEIETFYQSYNFWWQQKKPFVTAKLALSLDAKIAGPHGEPVVITGKELRVFTHQQRKRADALLTTSKTLKQDDPQLNVRLDDETISKPLYVLDSQLATPVTAKVFTTASQVTLFHGPNVDQQRLQALQTKGARCIELPTASNGINLEQVLFCIAQAGIHDLWIEAGGHCFENFLAAGLVQRALIYIAPKYLGSNAQAAFTAEQDIFAKVKSYKWISMGNDIMCEMFWS